MASASRPNILLITSDQQHWQTLGINNSRLKTPALDGLARDGCNFTRAYCNNPVCSPSRSTIITGLYPAWHGCWTIGVKLAEDVPNVGTLFSRDGYNTTLIGKAHFQPLRSEPGQESLESYSRLRDLDFWRGFHEPWYGFDHIELARNHADEFLAGQHYAIWMEEQGLKNWRDYFDDPPPATSKGRRWHWDLPQEFHYTTWTAQRTIANIQRSVSEGKPFFAWASFHDPHPPYLVPEPWASMYDPADMLPGTLVPGELDFMPWHFGKTQEPDPDFTALQETKWMSHGLHSHLGDEANQRKDMAVYYGMISFVDEQIGRILDSLAHLGIAENTLVVFTTDHGHFLGQHGLWAKGPFLYEDLIRLPFIVRYPRRVPAGTSSSSLQALIDLPSTFLSAAGIEVPGLMQGVNQLEVWTGSRTAARERVIVEFRHQPTAIHLRTYIDSRYKLTVYRDKEYGELFDFLDDPQERRNRWDDPAFATIKANLMHRFLHAEMEREPMRFERIAHA